MYSLNNILLFDGAMGSMLQKGGMPLGIKPESYNLSDPERIKSIHKAYLDAGAKVITANTFGANGLKFDNAPEIIAAGVALAKQAAEPYNAQVALDIGPLGKMLKPIGELEFEQAVGLFKEIIRAGKEADIILIETMTDIYEAKAAVLAAKELGGKPVFCSMTLEENGRTMTGSAPEIIVAVLEGLGVDVIGLNCGRGASGYVQAVEQMLECASVPVMLQPNAGIPYVKDGQTVYPQSPDEFAAAVKELAEKGVGVIGGCCGTSPEHIAACTKAVENLKYTMPSKKTHTVACSYSQYVTFGHSPIIVGERLNPTGKKKIAAALRERNWSVLLNEASAQSNADILDVNAGLPDINETEALSGLVTQLQAVSPMPLQIDSAHPDALEKSLRLYNGKAVLNSVCGKPESLDGILPIAAKYGAAVVALTLDSDGIPPTAEGRFAIAKRIERVAASYGVEKRDLIIDPLTLTASAQQEGIRETLKALEMLKNDGFKTILGVSNVSFGLPNRELLNSAFLTMALYAGLDACIINPSSAAMLDAVSAAEVLTGTDSGSGKYIEKYASVTTMEQVDNKPNLIASIEKGMSSHAADMAEELIKACQPIEIIEKHIVPALQNVGVQYETGKIFLPQLMKSAGAAQAVFQIIKKHAENHEKPPLRGRMIIATVRGDIHDIGKNIVATLVENFGFEVIDLGKDVPPKTIADAVKRENIKLLGLSALMTTTVAAMEETVKTVKAQCPDCHIVVGGAVLNEIYAKQIGADGYCADAMAAVRYVEEFYN